MLEPAPRPHWVTTTLHCQHGPQASGHTGARPRPARSSQRKDSRTPARPPARPPAAAAAAPCHPPTHTAASMPWPTTTLDARARRERAATRTRERHCRVLNSPDQNARGVRDHQQPAVMRAAAVQQQRQPPDPGLRVWGGAALPAGTGRRGCAAEGTASKAGGGGHCGCGGCCRAASVLWEARTAVRAHSSGAARGTRTRARRLLVHQAPITALPCVQVPILGKPGTELPQEGSLVRFRGMVSRACACARVVCSARWPPRVQATHDLCARAHTQ